MQSTAFTLDVFHTAAWNPVHSITLHGIHCIQWDPLRYTASNPLHSIWIHCATLNGIHCIESCCMESTLFNRDPFGHTAWNISTIFLVLKQTCSIHQAWLQSRLLTQGPYWKVRLISKCKKKTLLFLLSKKAQGLSQLPKIMPSKSPIHSAAPATFSTNLNPRPSRAWEWPAHDTTLMLCVSHLTLEEHKPFWKPVNASSTLNTLPHNHLLAPSSRHLL